MNETNLKIVLEALAETIQKLRVDVIILKGENERLREENAELKRQRDALCKQEAADGKL